LNENIFEQELEAFKSASAEELFINSPTYAEWIMPDGEVIPRPLSSGKDGSKNLRYFLQDFAYQQNTRLDLQIPSAGGKWGSFRWQASIPPATDTGGLLSLRRIFPRSWALEDYELKIGSTNQIAEAFSQNKTLVVFGTPGAGKTSFISALCHRYYAKQRVLFFEDCMEIPLRCTRWIRLLKTQPDRNTLRQQSICDQIKASLRLRPEAFIFGETRDKEDVANIENARLAIPKSCLTTFHAADKPAAIKRWTELGGSTHNILFLQVPPRKKRTKKK